jgi:hypothetical protein
MIGRRHQIVHRQDKALVPSSGVYALQPIGPADVAGWVGAVIAFVGSVLTEMYSKRELSADLQKAFALLVAELKAQP